MSGLYDDFEETASWALGELSRLRARVVELEAAGRPLTVRDVDEAVYAWVSGERHVDIVHRLNGIARGEGSE